MASGGIRSEKGFGNISEPEHRIAMMYVAGASGRVIAQTLGMDEFYVNEVLRRPKVRQTVLQLTGMVATDIAPVIRAFEDKLKAVEDEMFGIEVGSARRLHDLADNADTIGNAIKASVGAAGVASSVLARAGRAAPKKVEVVREHRVSDESLEKIRAAIGAARSKGDELGFGKVSEVGRAKVRQITGPEDGD